MPYEKWVKAFRILKDCGIKFNLILGNEPLLLGEKLVKLVEFWYREDIYYALYTTSPEPWFSKYKDKLVKAGLQNWSSGVDFHPEVYKQTFPNLTETCKKLVNACKKTLVTKAVESLQGQQYMYEKGVPEILSLATISRMNIEFLPEMIEYFGQNIIKDRRWKISVNYVEFKHGTDNDFASEDVGYALQPKDYQIWKTFIQKMEEVYKKSPFIQPTYDYLTNWEKIVNQNSTWGMEFESLSVDCDGRMRKCGYRLGKNVRKFTVFDLEHRYDEYLQALEKDLQTCEGCYWVYPYMLTKTKDIVDFRSEYWKGKYET